MLAMVAKLSARSNFLRIATESSQLHRISERCNNCCDVLRHLHSRLQFRNRIQEEASRTSSFVNAPSFVSGNSSQRACVIDMLRNRLGWPDRRGGSYRDNVATPVGCPSYP